METAEMLRPPVPAPLEASPAKVSAASAARLTAVAWLLFALCMSPAAVAQQAMKYMQSIRDTETHVLESAIINREFKLLIKLPAAYKERPDEKFPTVYLLDGGATYPMLAAYYHYLHAENAVPELIIVGISYGTDTLEEGNYRSTDYTAPAEERDYWGGAADFTQVLEREVLPFIESRYRANPVKRILYGQSLGGQFVLFAALNRPDLFRGFIASNPALHRNLDYFLNFAPKGKPSGSRLLVASGSNDHPRFREPAVAFMEKWLHDENLPWDMKTLTINGYGHFSLAPESFRQGLMWVFAGD